MKSEQSYHWVALYTKSRHESRVDSRLRECGITSFLPKQKVLRQWSDRKKWVDEPLFRSYVFVHGDAKAYYQAVQFPGAVCMVSVNGHPLIVRDEEIERIKQVLRIHPNVESCPAADIGDWVEIMRGPLIGLTGRIVSMRGERRMVVNIPSIQQGLRFNVDWSDVRMIPEKK